ncbi:MAG: hypothetical protein RBG13Loki_2521 [Promethearchaeota archaeon CR_4]|nr:MAG: hypothetical protein RBG13Loki_2521 [Candidatus Lokiarchaeota archaeon CR_4]
MPLIQKGLMRVLEKTSAHQDFKRTAPFLVKSAVPSGQFRVKEKAFFLIYTIFPDFK